MVKQQTLENVAELLEDYEDIENGLGADVLLDGVLEIKQDLMLNKGAEGHRNERISIMIHKGEPLPKLFETRLFDSAIADLSYEVHIAEIVSMQWTPEFDVIVHVLGKRSKEIPIAKGVH